MDQVMELLRSVLPGMWRHRWGGLLIAVLVGVAGSVIALKIPSKYQATTRVFVDTQSILKPLMVGLAIQPNVDQQVAMMARTLMNRPNIDRVMRMSDLDLRVSSPGDRDAMLDRLAKDIQFAPGGEANLYSITYSNPSPESARKVVQSLLDIFVESNLGDKRRDSEQARRFIDEQIASYEKRLQAAEIALRDFKIQNLSSMPGAQQDYVASAREARIELDQARAELRQAEGARDALKREVALEQPMSGPAEFSAGAEAPRITDTDVRLQEARKRMDELIVRYTDAHPDVVNLRLIMKQLEEQKRAELKADAQRKPAPRSSGPSFGSGDSAYSVIRASLAAAEAQVASLRARVGTAQAKVAASVRSAQTVPKVEADLVQLNRDYQINKLNYEQLLARRESAQIAGSMESSTGVAEFRVVDPPRVGPNPVWPNRLLLLALALGASIAAGVGYTLLREQLRPAFFTMRSLREATAVPSLGAVTLFQPPAARWRARLVMFAFTASVLIYVGGFALGAAYLAVKPLAL